MKLVEAKGRIEAYPQRHGERAVEATEKGLLAIRLLKIALATDPELTLGDEEHMEFRKSWRLTKQMLSAAEIASFKEMLKHYGD